MTRYKVRIRFAKTGDLRFLSHHDLIRLFERMMRRAGLPFRSSEGFHPKPKMAFANALGLGIIGRQEVVEIELMEELSAEQIQTSLSAQAPQGLEILSIRAIAVNQNAQVRRACYHLDIDSNCYPDLRERIAEIMHQTECWVERAKPTPRRVNIRPFLLNLRVDSSGLLMEFAVTPHGSARSEEVLRLLGLGDLLLNGAVLERALLEIEDEINNERDQGPGIRDQGWGNRQSASSSLIPHP